MKKSNETLSSIYISKQSKVDCSQHQQGQEYAQLCCSSNWEHGCSYHAHNELCN